MEVRLVADELAKCHKAEGVNHYENCTWLSEKYMAMLKENRVRVTQAFKSKFDRTLRTGQGV
jgi:hypothetical protein